MNAKLGKSDTELDDANSTEREPAFLFNLHQGRLHGALARKIGINILSGVHKSGDILPNEMEASASHDISRSGYREAIRILAAKGLVESKPKLGTRVSQRVRWNILDPEVLGWMFASEPSAEFVNSLFELRLITEPAAAALAAERRTQADIDKMAACIEVMKKHTLATEIGRNADLEFHDCLMGATKNEALASLSTSIGAAVAWTTIFKQRQNELPRDPLPDHIAVFEAIERKDANYARWCMETLVRMALKDTHASM